MRHRSPSSVITFRSRTTTYRSQMYEARRRRRFKARSSSTDGGDDARRKVDARRSARSATFRRRRFAAVNSGQPTRPTGKAHLSGTTAIIPASYHGRKANDCDDLNIAATNCRSVT